MSAHVLLNFLNKLRKRSKQCFRNKFYQFIGIGEVAWSDT